VNDNFLAKATINNVTTDDLTVFQNGEGVTLHKGAIACADALILGSESYSDTVKKAIDEADKPKLDYISEEEDYPAAYLEFYQSLLEEKVSE